MIITIAAQKGGVSKTTTAAAIAQALSFKKKKVLLVDVDAQGSATLIYGASEAGSGGSYALITGKKKAKDLIQTTDAGAIIPASNFIDQLDIELNNKPGRDSFLKNALDPIKEEYDYIIIDTAPGLGTALVQALTAADKVIIPLLADPQALQGLHQVHETIEQVQKYCNPALEIACVVITQYQARATLTRQYEELIADQCKDMKMRFAATKIRKGIAIQEAQALRKNLYAYAPASNPALDYMALLQELKLIRSTKKA